MAEALAAIGVAASIVGLVDFSAKIVHRLEEFHSKLDDVPASFQHVRSQLPLLLEALKATQHDIDAGVIKHEEVLLPVINGCKIQIEALDSILDKKLPSPIDSRTKKSTKAILSIFNDSKIERITATLRNYIQTLTFYHTAIRSTLNPMKDGKLVRIRQWLSAPDPSHNFHQALKLRHHDTGLWFRDSDQFAKWKTNPSSLIWLYGIPGCGKTILSSTIIENIQQHCDNDPGKIAAYFYFDFIDPQKQQSELMIKSLVSQLSYKCVDIPSALDSLFRSCGEGLSQPSTDAILDVLRQMCCKFPAIYIILDALDECTDRDELMATIETIVGWRVESLHILVTSRMERVIELSLKDLINPSDTIPLQKSIVNEDIQRYVRHRLSIDRSLKKWQKDPDICDEIEAALRKGANGMFRWAVCQLDTLGKCLNRKSLRKALKELPPTLDKTYQRILCAIDDNHSTYALRILQWLAFSERPLSLDEIAEVVAIDPRRRPVLDRDDILEEPLDALTVCSSLVALSTANDMDNSEPDEYESDTNSSTQILILAHYSVKEYLVSERIQQSPAKIYALQERTANTFIANCCLGYLLQFQDAESLYTNSPFEYQTGSFDINIIRIYKLARYSARYWTTHARLSDHNTTQSLIMELFSHKNEAYRNWICIYDLDSESSITDTIHTILIVPALPLYYASLANLTEIVRSLIQDGYADVNARGGRYDSALQAAAARGSEMVIKLLIDAGADVNAGGDGRYGGALQAAAAHPSETVSKTIVKLLIDAGADVNVTGGRHHGSALMYAAANGHEAVVNLLLEVGAEVNVQDGSYGSALIAAVTTGYKTVVKRLIDVGADVNVQNDQYGSVLHIAVASGYKAIVKLLINAGADVNIQNNQYGSVLHIAVFGGYEAIIKLLIDAGADVNAQGGRYGSRSLDKMARGHEALVNLLQEADVFSNAERRSYGSALQVAVAYGHEAVVKLLIDAGADVNVRYNFSNSALSIAAGNGHETVVKQLLEAGANVNARDSIYDSPLQAAVIRGHETVVKLLLNAGADINVQGGHYHNAVQAAAYHGHVMVVKLLLDAGADVNIQGGWCGNALQAAAIINNEEIITLLLNAGADVNIQGGYYGNALQAATKGGHKTIIKLLLEASVIYRE